MRHIFKDFTSYYDTPFEEFRIVVEKDTKKAVKEAILQVDECKKGSDKRLIFIDMENVRKPENIASFVAYSLYLHRNISHRDFKAMKVQLHPDCVVSEVSDLDLAQFRRMSRTGGSWQDYAVIEGINWGAINKLINDDIDDKLRRLNAIRESYQPYIDLINPEQTKINFNRRWNFHVRNHDLMTLYKNCFNEIELVTSPEMCCNPNPSFQRGLVWSEEKKREFIHSILNEIPIGSFYVNRPELDGDERLKLCEGYGSLLWDGKQRLHALDDFFKGKFAVQVQGKMVYYHESAAFFYHKFSSCMITQYMSYFNTLREVIEAYVVINSAQVKHTDEDLQKAIDFLESQGQPS